MFSLLQNDESYPVIRTWYYVIKYFNEVFTGGRELGNHFITKVLEGIKRLSGYTENPKSSISSSDLKRAFQYLGGVEIRDLWYSSFPLLVFLDLAICRT